MTILEIEFIDHALYQKFMKWFDNEGFDSFQEFMIGETGVSGIEYIEHKNTTRIELNNEYDYSEKD